MKKLEIIKSSREYTEIINLNKSKKNKYFSIFPNKNIPIAINKFIFDNI